MIPDQLTDNGHFAGAGENLAERARPRSPASALCSCIHAALLLALTWATIGCEGVGLPLPDLSVRCLAFGDSSTSGDSGRDYVAFLPELLGRPSTDFANQGKGGETAHEGLKRLRQLIAMGVYPNADTLLYWQGGVDVIDLIRDVDGLLLLSPTASTYPYSGQLDERLNRIQADIEAAIAEGQAAGLTVYVATYFSLRETVATCDALFLDIMLPAQARNANGYLSLLNARIRQAAANAGAVVVDVASVDDSLRADDSNFLNCNHLSAKGNQIVAQLFAQVIGQVGGG